MKRILGLLMAVTILFGATAFAATPNVKKASGKAAIKATTKKKAVRKPKKHRRHHKGRKTMKAATTGTGTKTQSNQ